MNDLTVGKEGRQIFYFAMPMLLGNVFQQGYMIIESIIVGKFLGKEALAILGASFPIIFVFISLIIGITMGGTIIISQYTGAKDFNKVKRTVDTLFVFLFFTSILISTIGVLFSRKIFIMIGLPAELLHQATLYLNIYFIGIIVFFGFYGVSGILRGMGDSKTPLVFMVIASVLNVLLDLLFIIVFKFGIIGVAVATVIAEGIAFLIAIIYLNRTHKLIRFSIKKVQFNKQIFYQSVKIGLPTGFQQSFVAFGMMALVGIVNMFGVNAIAAYTIAGRIDSFAALPAMNFSTALSTFVGQNLGANKQDRVRKGLLTTWFMTSAISVAITCIALLFGKSLMGMFTNDVEVINLGVRYLIIVGSFYMFFSTMFVLNGVFRGAGDTLIPMFFTLIAWVVRIPIAYFLSKEIGTDGIWWSIPAAWLVGFALSLIYYYAGNWKAKVVVKHPIEQPVNIV